MIIPVHHPHATQVFLIPIRDSIPHTFGHHPKLEYRTIQVGPALLGCRWRTQTCETCDGFGETVGRGHCTVCNGAGNVPLVDHPNQTDIP